MSPRINKRHAQFSFSSKVVKASLSSRICSKPTAFPMVTLSQLIFRGESRLEPKLKEKWKTDFEPFWNSHFLSFSKIGLTDFYLLCVNVKSEQISYSSTFEVGSYGYILRKTSFNLRMHILSSGARSLILTIY